MAQDGDKKYSRKNFTAEETDLLFECIKPYVGCVVDTKKDSVSVSFKNTAWNKIAERFNNFTNGTKRDAESLQSKFSSLKSETNKAIAERKVFSYSSVDFTHLILNITSVYYSP